MDKKRYFLALIITITLFLTSCNNDGIDSINIFELPWESLTLKNFLQVPIIIAIIHIPLGLRVIYREIFFSQWAGKKIMKVKLKKINYSLWIVLIALLGLIGFIYISANNYVQFLMESSLSQEIIEGMILMRLLRYIAVLYVFLQLGLLLVLRLLRQLEIRENGINHGIGFIPWENIVLAEWKEAGTLEIHYYWTSKPFLLFFWKKNKKEIQEKANCCLKINIEEKARINRHLERFIPDRIIAR
ncbi:hypothetical protein Amet_0629 [Alkaliphilus metalliredigens QYMF]|uniref:DUF5673 domain-containing protein n=1 Tax=Alkaliphilus metalliredigens (strain QYMF) TaxID=293826 RepID=A6TKY7_ALKMQ|nr:hypothetical protein [Alkaliphilus metalliredigens]ABR46855.1 hypothetical protein Amet_0629 [Alkaliphilus metalliredigens QYMF]